MKKLKLKTPAYQFLETAFGEWLDILGYAPTTVYNLPTQVREFLYWLEQRGITQIKAIETHHIRQIDSS